MARDTGRRLSLGNIKLGQQLIIGFGALSLIVGATGAAGLHFANQIGDLVAGFTDTASPLLNESFALVETTEAARIHVMQALESSDRRKVEAVRAELGELKSESAKRLLTVGTIAAGAGISLDLKSAETLKSEFADQLMQMLDSRAAARVSNAAVMQRFRDVEKVTAELDEVLAVFAKTSETRMTGREDEAKSMIVGGSATVPTLGKILEETFNQSFPVLQGAYTLMSYLTELRNLTRAYMTVVDGSELDALEAEFQKQLKRAEGRLKRIAGRAGPDEAAEITKVQSGLKALQAGVAGPGGLFESRRAGLADNDRVRALDAAANTTAAKYEQNLGTVADAARQLNQRLSAEAVTATAQALTAIGIVVLIGIVAGLGFAFGLARSIGRPLGRMSDAMRRLAGGDHAIDDAYTAQGNEIGDLARALRVFRDNAVESERLRAEARERDRRAEEQKRAETLRMADELEASVKQVVEIVAGSADEMRGSAEELLAAAADTNHRAGTVASAAELATGNAQTVAAAAEELTMSIEEIGRQIHGASGAIREASEHAGRTSTRIGDLSESARRIGSVVNLISEIAGQTNLLALNATIEAARAGEAGKGFSVVATEVKNLATQTAKATEEISAQISGMQSATAETVKAIELVVRAMNRIDEQASQISAAVEQQNAATQEIASNVQQSANHTREVSMTISEVTAAASNSAESSERVVSGASELAIQSRNLRSELEQFLAKLRAA